MKTLVIEREAVRRNAAVVKERAGSAVIYAVLTGDGQGAGLVDLAKLLRGEGIGRFAVAEAADAAALRKAGFVDEEILMLRSTAVREELETLMDLNVVCAIGSHDAGVALNGLAEARSTVAEAHIQVDVGLGCGGFLSSELEKILSMYRYLPNVALSGLFTQVSGGFRPEAGLLAELRRVTAAVHAAGFETGLVHAGGSEALLAGCLEGLDGVQAGAAFLGRRPRRRGSGLKAAGWGEALIEEVRWLPRGHLAGGLRPAPLRRPARVGVLSVGYENGFGLPDPGCSGLPALLRQWWKVRRCFVQVGEQRVRVIGGPGPRETLLDLTDLKCGPGDTAVFELDPLLSRGMPREYR